MDNIQQIISLQHIDSQLQEIAELLGDLPKKVDELKNEESALIQSVEDGKLRLKELDVELNKSEGLVKDINIKIDKYKDQLFLVTSNKQYDALQLEIDHLKDELDVIETRFLEYTEEKEQLVEKVQSEEENLDLLKKDLIDRRSKLEILMNESSEQKLKLESDREVQIGNINQSILTQYSRVSDARDGLSVVTISGSACGGCGAFVPPQIVSEVRAAKGFHTCDSCSRFLYWDSE
tara:strand:+ start:635 stop:1339 length:705 start_codon:yes stop_codon:yes gene_type:complete